MSGGPGSSTLSLLLPESPALEGYLTPDLGGGEAGPSTFSTRTSIPPPPPLLDLSPMSILARLEEEEQSQDAEGGLRISLILQHALRHAIEHADNDLLLWLLALDDPFAEALDEVAAEMEGEDGWGVVGMAIASSSGRQEKEDGVRAIVVRWGLEYGHRRGRDTAGWTPLHLAALISTPPLISFLLTRGASPHAENDRGLTPLDLVSGMETRQQATSLLQHATATGSSRSTTPLPPIPREDGPELSGKRREMLQKRRRKLAEMTKRDEEEERLARMKQEKEEWVKGLLAVVGVDPSLVLPASQRRNSGWLDEESGEDTDGGDDEDKVTAPASVDDTSLVWGPSTLPHILDTFISNYQPICQPVSKRSLPANAIYLYARFAHYHCDDSWLDELLIGTLDRIEEAVYKNVDDLAFLAFWTYNTTLLLYLIRCDKALAEAAEKLLVQLEELANAIHVFVIRIGERKVDEVFDDALLEYETLEDFDDVRFEGEWTLFRSFAPKKQRSTAIPKASTIFAPSPSAPEAPSPSLLDTLKGKIDASPFKVPKSHQSLHDLRGSALDTAHNAVFGAPKGGPRNVTEILSAVLVVMQLYDVNPVITIQAFSQIFFWVACELFNRILSRKKYLCRTKAVQIRMNITVLEDWVRTHGLPVRTVTQHFEPVTQLLQWLQCQSALSKFDDLIGTLQNMRSINPLQMRRVVRDYRFEVSEGRMTDECAQYLVQLQKDWERRRAQVNVETIKTKSNPKRQSSTDDLDDPTVYSGYQVIEPPTPIDALWDASMPLTDFIPATGPETDSELLDSRFMLPFQLPKDYQYLVATPPPDAAYAIVFPPGTWSMDGHRNSRPPSRASFQSSRPLAWSLPSPRAIRALPLGFFGWLRERDADRRHRREGLKPPTELHRATNNPLTESGRSNILSATAIDTVRPSKLSSLPEDESTPIASSISAPSFPSAGLPTSTSIDQLRQKSKTAWNPSPPSLTSKDSYELSPVPMPSRPTFATSSSGARTDVSSMSSSGSTDSVGGSTGKRRWWKLGRKASQADLNEAEMVGLPRKRRDDGLDSISFSFSPAVTGGGMGERSGTATPIARTT